MKPLADAHIGNMPGWKSFQQFLAKKQKGLRTGIEALDATLMGIGGVTVIQGETGTNKSTLALQIALHNLKKSVPVLMIDKENGEGRIRSRLLCQYYNKCERSIRAQSIEQLTEMIKPVADLPLYIYTESIKNTEEIAQRVRDLRTSHPQQPAILLIDSLQAMNAIDDDQRISLEKWMYFFDELKVQHDGKLTIIITSEKNRASYGSAEVGGAKGSNSVEYKAETLLDLRMLDNGNLRLKVAKSRDGARGMEVDLAKVFEDGQATSFTFNLVGLGIDL